MYDRRVKRLPVVNKAGRLVGIISRVDVLAVFSRPDADIRDEVIHRVLPGIMPTGPTNFNVAVRELPGSGSARVGQWQTRRAPMANVTQS